VRSTYSATIEVGINVDDDQLRDTFRAAGYDKATTEQYVRTSRARIKGLNRLPDAKLARHTRNGR
jgi:trimethylamine:corrinoid methyltransferase-like protein